MSPSERLVRDLVESVWNGCAWDRLPAFFAATFDHNGRADTPDGRHHDPAMISRHHDPA